MTFFAFNFLEEYTVLNDKYFSISEVSFKKNCIISKIRKNAPSKRAYTDAH